MDKCKKNKRNLLISVSALVLIVIIVNLLDTELHKSNIEPYRYSMIMLWARYFQSIPLAFIFIYIGRLIKNYKNGLYIVFSYVFTFGGYLAFILPLFVTIVDHFFTLNILYKYR